MLRSKLNKKAVFITIVFICLVLWLALTSPTNGSPVLLLIPFVLIFILLYNLIRWLVHHISAASNSNRQQAISWFVGLVIDVAIVLSSLGGLGLRDGLTLLAITGLGFFYVIKIMPVKARD